MPSYSVSPKAFFEAFSPDNHAYAPRIQQGITQLVQRYAIKGRSILSLGAGTAAEECYFWRHGNRLTIIDIDEHQAIGPVLEKLPPGDMNYTIDDADNVQISQQFDVLYISSLTPDELRRSDIVRQRDTDVFRRMLELNNGLWEWPWWEEPFHPLTMRFAGLLRPGGLMIVQSYAGGFDVAEQRYYLWALDQQLSRHGMALIEVYRFAETTGVMLYIIAKGKPENMPLFPPITIFHGRGTAERVQCLRLYGPPRASV